MEIFVFLAQLVQNYAWPFSLFEKKLLSREHESAFMTSVPRMPGDLISIPRLLSQVIGVFRPGVFFTCADEVCPCSLWCSTRACKLRGLSGEVRFHPCFLEKFSCFEDYAERGAKISLCADYYSWNLRITCIHKTTILQVSAKLYTCLSVEK